VIGVKSCALAAAVATDVEPSRRVGQVGTAEYPRADRERMDGRDLAALGREPQRLGAHADAGHRLAEVQPTIGSTRLGAVDRDLMMAA
jgi:hypothetical protein